MKNRAIWISSLFLSLLPTTSLADHPARPVKSADQALTLAKHWADDAKMVGLKVGQAKNLSLVYAIDLVEADEPSIHANHLIIRKDDGFSALVYPAHDAPKLNREHRLGLDGLSGMAGMTGMSGATQSKSGNPVGNDIEARRHVDRWLQSNNIGEMFELEDVVSMNNVYLVDLYERKTHKVVNQAIVRAVDGYVSLVRSIKLPGREIPAYSTKRP